MFDQPESFSFSSTRILAGVAIVVVLGEYCRGRLFAKDALPLPPGPPPSWFWNSAMPSNNVALTVTQWMQEYGPVVSVRQGNQVSVIIGSVEAANDIMEKEGSALVDRPHAIAADEMLSQNMRLVLIGVGSRFRRFRKAAGLQLQPKAVEAYRDIQVEDAKRLMHDILRAPDEHQEHAKRFAHSVILRITYGKSTPTANTDPEVIGMNLVLERFGLVMQPGAFLVDRIPILRYVPWYGRQLKTWFREEHELGLGQMERVKNEIASGIAGPSFMRTLLEQHQHQLSKDEMSFLGGTIFGAAADNQLDAVVGRERAPSFKDIQHLTQLQAFMHETLRLEARRPARDIIWRGFRIPAGATVYGCHCCLFLTPKNLIPRDGLTCCGHIRPDLKSFPFGFGRRSRTDSMLITLAHLFWTFRISEPKDAPIDRWAFEDNVIAHPKPFSVKFSPRFDVGYLEEVMGQS
ncbi:cytochrome P450 [Suillus paluster]|uniref:cytochrome P450 n=1 Tax=Suillus paluster TaxID=48578 RepID=UPI001B86B39D|nr:cytochrome P450 [Suillus paluster]KAG1731326.1 cytochrome P450 [Suillus paluster]